MEQDRTRLGHRTDLQTIDGGDGAGGGCQELVVVALVALRVDLAIPKMDKVTKRSCRHHVQAAISETVIMISMMHVLMRLKA